MSGFAFHGSAPKTSPEGGAGDSPEVAAQLEQLMGQMQGIDENDPRAMGRLMRRMSEITGEGMDDPALEEAVRRLEGGEDPERVEELMESAGSDGGTGGSFGAPNMDSGIYDM